MAANTIGLSYAEIRRWIGREIGANRDPSVWTSIQSTDASDILKAGLRQAYWPPILQGENSAYVWSFLQPTLAQLELHAAYTSGSVAITTGTVTLTSGTWPSWAAQAELWVHDSWYSVATRVSDSSIILDDSSVTGLAGQSYSLIQREYDLPDDFGGLVEPFTWRGDEFNLCEITTVNEAQIRSFDGSPRLSGSPQSAAIVSVAPTSAQESKSAAMFAPYPDKIYKLWYRYSVVPPMLDGSSYVYAHGGAQFSETILLSCLDKAMQTLYQSFEKHEPFLESLRASISQDRKLNRPDSLGYGVYSEGFDRYWSGGPRERNNNRATLGNISL